MAGVLKLAGEDGPSFHLARVGRVRVGLERRASRGTETACCWIGLDGP